MAWNIVNTESDKVKAAIIQEETGGPLYFLYEDTKFLLVTTDLAKIETTVAFMDGKNVSVFSSENKKSERIF